MRFTLSALVALQLIASPAGSADAASPQHGKRLKAAPADTAKARGTHKPAAGGGQSDYYERILDKVPFGSQLWWRVYDSQPKGR